MSASATRKFGFGCVLQVLVLEAVFPELSPHLQTSASVNQAQCFLSVGKPTLVCGHGDVSLSVFLLSELQLRASRLGFS
jgi:hypothetical protein